MAADICIIGAGPAGMTAAITAASVGGGLKVLVLEAGSRPGRKLLVTGGGRCNVTNLSQPRQFLAECKPFDKFLRHSIYHFPPTATVEFLSNMGIDTKVMDNGHVFPVSEKSAEVNNAFFETAKSLGVEFMFAAKVSSVEKNSAGFDIKTDNGKNVTAKTLIIATGGKSWPQTGSDGSGFVLAKSLGHKMIAPIPSLVPLITAQAWPGKIQGIALDEIVVSTKIGSKKITSAGALVFTQTGISGPAVLDFSRKLLNMTTKFPADIKIDLLLHISSEQIEKKLADALASSPRKMVLTIIAELLPANLAAQLCRLAGVDDVKISQFSKIGRKKLLELIKHLPLTITALGALETATVTRGGVELAQIDSLTMGSKICPSLFFAGEVINVDGPCGGYNLQIAFATARLAAESAVKVSLIV